MIAYDFSTESKRGRTNIYNLLSPTGRAHLALLLQKERDIANNFTLSYETADLRRLAAKASRGGVTPEEQALLDKSPKVFKGVLSGGGVIENPKAIKVISEYLDCEDIIDEDLKFLQDFVNEEAQQNSEIILGKQMSFWNLHPNTFPEAVYASLFDTPEYTREELSKLFFMKLGTEKEKQPAKIFKSKKEVEELLNNYDGNDADKSNLINKLVELRVVGDISPTEYKTHLVKAIKLLLAKDAEFDFEVYQEVKDVLPQYHNKKTKYFIFLLAQYNYIQKLPVSSRIDLTTIHAFYRKADELCSS